MPEREEPVASKELPGKRVRLRPLRAEDAEPLFEAVESSREALKRWLAWVPGAAAAADEAAFLRRVDEEDSRGESSVWGLVEARTGVLVGVVSLGSLAPAERDRLLSGWRRAVKAAIIAAPDRA